MRYFCHGAPAIERNLFQGVMPVEVLGEEEMRCSVEVRVFCVFFSFSFSFFFGGWGGNRKEGEKGGNAK